MSYTTNFKPADFLHFNNIKIFKVKKNKNNKIISRNFFLFLILLKYVNFENNLVSVSIFVKPFFNKFITLLRAPYRYKLARHQFMLSRYHVSININIQSKSLVITNINDIIKFLNFLKKTCLWFESNIVAQHSIKFQFNFKFNYFFLII